MKLLVVLAAAAAVIGSASAAPRPKKPPPLLHPHRLHAHAPLFYRARFTTTKGSFVVSVRRQWAPHGADRFYNLVRAGFYDRARLFRVIPGFVVQWGISPSPRVARAWEHATIRDDPVELSNTKGTVAFAATSARNSRTTQVFVNLGRNVDLDPEGFAPFGVVTRGLAVFGKLYAGYGEEPTARQVDMIAQGDAFVQATFPKLDRILRATILEASPAR